MSTLLITNAEVDSAPVDVLVRGDHIAALGLNLARPRGAEHLDAGGGALLPGLHDHHLHLLALGAAGRSIDVSPKMTPDRAAFGATMTAAATRSANGEWLRAVGYHERVAGDIDRWALDAIVADQPVRVQHRSGALWILNSAALAAVDLLDGDRPSGTEVDEYDAPTGRLYRLDDWLRDRVPTSPVDLGHVGRSLAAYGVTGVTDATPYTDTSPFQALADAVRSHALPVRVHVMGAPSIDPREIQAPLDVGPAKLLLPDHELPSLDDVVADIQLARSYGRAIAVHCVTRVALVLTLTALDAVGPLDGDRIEHGAVIGTDLMPLVARTGATVVTQPNFVAERGDDYLADVGPEDRDDLWPCASLLTAGIPVGAGSDAPHGALDPWALVHAATRRATSAGRILGAAERISARRGLDLLLTPADHPGGVPRRIDVGEPSDLCVLHGPLVEALRDLPANPVRTTIASGRITHNGA